jgi:hypothetical protein
VRDPGIPRVLCAISPRQAFALSDQDHAWRIERMTEVNANIDSIQPHHRRRSANLPVAACFAVAVTAVLVLSGCGGGPASKAEVCDSFTQVGTQLLQGNGIIGNPLFSKVKDLGSTAQRYQGDPSVASDGQKLSDLGGGDTLSGGDLMTASANIANLCGHPLGLG